MTADAERDMRVIQMSRTADRANRATANIARKQIVDDARWYVTDPTEFEIATRYKRYNPKAQQYAV